MKHNLASLEIFNSIMCHHIGRDIALQRLYWAIFERWEEKQKAIAQFLTLGLTIPQVVQAWGLTPEETD